MKQFIMKNIVLTIILVATLVSSVFLIFFIWEKSQTIKQSMSEIEENVEKVRAIDSASRPNSVAESEAKIKADTDTLTKKNVLIYRHFGKPYRPALLKLIKNITSPVELNSGLELDPSLVAKPKPKTVSDEDEDSDEEEVAEAAPSEPAAPTDEEKAIFNPSANLVILSFDEDSLRAMLAELYSEVHQDSSDDTFVIPDTIQAERAQLFEKLFNQIIEAPEVVDASRAEDFRKAAAAKFAQAFAVFREDVQALTLENVTNSVAHELFLDALGLPRLMRQRDCKNYIDFLYEKYYASDIIPGLPKDPSEREHLVQDFIYGKNLNRQALPVPEMVIPIIRNFQIKEDLFRRMKEAGIGRLSSMSAGVFYGSTIDSDSESPILVFTYTLDMVSSLDAIESFINSLQDAYKSDRVYVVKSIGLNAQYEDLMRANGLVLDHTESRGTSSTRKSTTATSEQDKQQQQQSAADQTGTAAGTQTSTASSRNAALYDLTDPRNPEYGKTLIGEERDEIECTIVVNYLFYRADNITQQ